MTTRGSLLIVTLWIVAILSALAVSIGRSLSMETRLTRHRLARQEAQALARGAVFAAVQLLQEDAAAGAVDWSGEAWAIPRVLTPAEGRQVTLTIMDEERKLSLQELTEPQLQLLVPNGEMVRAFLDWQDAADPAENAPPFYPKNAPIESPEELYELPGMTAEDYARITGAATPYTIAGTPPNLNTVTPEALQALGVSLQAIQVITQYRDGPDGPDVHEADGYFTRATIIDTLRGLGVVDEDINRVVSLGDASLTFTIVAEAVLTRPAARARVEAVVRRAAGGTEHPRVIAWRQ